MQVFAPDSNKIPSQHSSIKAPGNAKQTTAVKPAGVPAAAPKAQNGPTAKPTTTVPAQSAVSNGPKAAPGPKTQLTANKAPGGPALFASLASRPSIPATVPESPQTGPDYVSVFRDPKDEARYQERKKQQHDWNRHLASEPGFQEFSNAMYKVWEGTQWHWDGDVKTLTLDTINNSMIVFSFRNELENLRWTIRLGADLGFINSEKTNVLTGAAAQNADDCLRYLLTELKLNVSRRNGKGATALILAARSKKVATKEATLDLLIQTGAWLSEVTSDYEENILHELMRCGENHSGHISIALSILEKYGDRNVKLGNRKGFDYSQICISHYTVLYDSFIKLTVNLENLMREGKFNFTTATEFEYIKIVLVPVIQLCKKIHELSGIPYAALPDYQGRTAFPAIMKFSTVDETYGIEMLKLLMLVDKHFMEEIYRDCLSIHTNKHVTEFVDLYKKAEIKFKQSTLLAAFSSVIPIDMGISRSIRM